MPLTAGPTATGAIALAQAAYDANDLLANDATAETDYASAAAGASAAHDIAVSQDQYNATLSAAQSTAAWTQAQDAATLSVTVSESQAYAVQQSTLAGLAEVAYQQMGDSYSTAMGKFADPKASTASPWATLEYLNAKAAAGYNDAALTAWLAAQQSTLAANSQAEITAAKVAAVFADQTAAAALAQTMSATTAALATARVAQRTSMASAVAAIQQGYWGGGGTPPVAPAMDPAYTIGTNKYFVAGVSADDYAISGTVSAAHADLVATAFSNPWGGWYGGWWSGTSMNEFSASAADNSTPHWSGGLSLVLTRLLAGSDYDVEMPGDFQKRLDSELARAGGWQGGWWNGGTQTWLAQHGLDVRTLDPAGISTAIQAKMPNTQNALTVTVVSTAVGIGVGVACSFSGFGAIFAGSAGMAAGNATSAYLNGLLTGQSGEQIVYNVFVSAGIGAIAGAAGGIAAKAIAPVAEAYVGALGLTCNNGLGALGAFVIGGADGAAFGAASSFTEVAIATGDLNRAGDAALQGGLMGGLIGGAISVGMNAIDPFVCFDVETQVIARVVRLRGESDAESGEILAAAGHSGAVAVHPLGSAVKQLAEKLHYVKRNIEDIRKDDYITSRDQNNPDGPLVLSRVERVFKRLADHLRILRIRDTAGREQVLRTTDEHPFRPDEKDWTFANNLQVGEFVVGLCGISGTLLATHREEHPEGVWVYNLRIEGTHTYFVCAKDSTAEPVWVHNANYASTSDELVELANGDVEFRGMTIQVQEDLSHISTQQLEYIAMEGVAPRTLNGERITLHHVGQNPEGPLWEIVSISTPKVRSLAFICCFLLLGGVMYV